MTEMFPTLRSVILDTTNARHLAEFYRQLLGYEYRPGDEPPPGGEPDPNGSDWLVLVDPTDTVRLYVYADPAGHPFCIFVAPEPG